MTSQTLVNTFRYFSQNLCQYHQWMQPQQQRADDMGFTTDPTNPNRFYASGHPQTGGNLGFQVSENLARDWQQISMPGVDFHALAIAVWMAVKLGKSGELAPKE